MNCIKKISKKALSLSRRSKVLSQLISDVLICFSCLLLALLLAGDSLHIFADRKILMGMILSTASCVIAFSSFGLYNTLVRFADGNILTIIAKGAFIGSSILLFFIIVTGVSVQLSVPIIYALVLFLSISGIRFVVRRLLLQKNHRSKKPAAIYGAGGAGRQLQNALLYHPEIKVVAFIDDNPLKQGLTVSGCRVYPNSSLVKLKKRYGVELVLLALPNIGRDRRRAIIETFQGIDLEIKTIPSMSKILTGQAQVSEVQPITPEMLLGRRPIHPVKKLMQRNIFGKCVMITGAGGSIGSELSKQALALEPLKIILFESSEIALYQIREELLQIKEKTKSAAIIVPILGSIQDQKRLAETIKGFGVTSIYHAAAYKHVPLVEDNVIEGVNNNVFGTLTLARVALEFGVESFTLVSTDKAVRPTNVMGATKRISELICQVFAEETPKTKFSMVRFGNVLGSSGSVIPLFKKQIEAGGPVTVTHPEITRYFMTIPEAAELVVQASSMAEGGDVFVLDMGEPVKILDLAVEMIELTGKTPYFQDQANQGFCDPGHIPVNVTGLRSGEKLYEELLLDDNAQPTEHPRIMKTTEVSLSKAQLDRHLKRLSNACQDNDLEKVLDIFQKMPLQFNHNR